MLSLSPLVDLTSRFVSNITLYFLLFVPLTLYALYNAYATPLRHVPGPFWAKFSRLWILGAVVSRKWDRIILDLHKKYGPIVRVAPHELSIDDPEIANIIYRAKESLPKVRCLFSSSISPSLANKYHLFSVSPLLRLGPPTARRTQSLHYARHRLSQQTPSRNRPPLRRPRHRLHRIPN